MLSVLGSRLEPILAPRLRLGRTSPDESRLKADAKPATKLFGTGGCASCCGRAVEDGEGATKESAEMDFLRDGGRFSVGDSRERATRFCAENTVENESKK
jgi:hypothetical protein